MADKIITRPATDEYKAGWDRIFGKKPMWIGVDPASGKDMTAFADEYLQHPTPEGVVDAPGRPIHDLPAQSPARGLLCRDSTA